MRLLLIEDDAALRLGLSRQLEAEGFRVDQAVDGEDVLFQAREYPIGTLRGRGYRFAL